MLIIDTKWDNFSDYINSLSNPAQKNYRAAKKRNADLDYCEIQYDEALVDKYMKIWERQLVHGEPVTWNFKINYLRKLAKKNKLKVFSGGDLAIHFIEKRGGYWLCHAPLYDKINNDRYLAKWMWFKLIEYAINNNMMPLDMGGGPNNWRKYIEDREKFPSQKYKWMYVPENIKNNPKDCTQYHYSWLTKKLIVSK
ncbi:hypothetical protein [Polynucleobacter sp. MWH-S4W17]|uniref:hypothetical protein n=1 Tax=Polynucleobacter sp. MWH-S4W17 TaxID=1855910 RepID=UPI001BFE050B|nr:hypothetical protein [Polynucleobacter sp. MWH-S4W17]QWD81928.1 hypothetical protein C2755_01735 [Polynucleobacter sp. MWH-S4W17]